MSASAEQSTKDLQASETMAQATAEGKAEGSTERVNEKQVEEIAALRGQLKEQHDHLTGMHEGMTKLLGELAITVCRCASNLGMKDSLNIPDPRTCTRCGHRQGNLLTSMDPAAEVREPEDICLKQTVEEMAKAALQERQRAVDERPAMDLAALRKELSGQHTSMAGMHTAQAELLDRLQSVV